MVQRRAAAAAAAASFVLVSLAVVSVSLPAVLKGTWQDAHDAKQRLEPVKRISIFDQWNAPNKPAQEDFETSNPSFAYVKPYVTVGRKFDAKVNQEMAQQCNSKCQTRPGYNPSLDVVSSCMKFCERLYDANDAVVVTPQPKTRGWWRRKADSFVPGGRYVHYVANPFGGGAPAMNGQSIPDPYHATPLGASEGTAWISTVEGRAGVDPKQSFIKAPAHSAPPAPPQFLVPPAPEEEEVEPQEEEETPSEEEDEEALPAPEDGPPLLMDSEADKAKPAALKVQRAEQLLMTDLVSVDATGSEGLQAIKFGRHTALRDLDDYFDTLPTKDCNKPTCSYVDVRKQQTKKLVSKGHKFTTKDIEKYERSVLGYHRRHEHAMTAAEMAKIGLESKTLVSKSVRGYNALENGAQTQGAVVLSDAAFRSQRHSAAYDRATKAKGFVGYYENVFADSKHTSSNPPEERDGLDGDSRRAAMRKRGSARLVGADKLEAAKALLAHDTYEAKLHLSKQESRFKQLVGARLKEEQASVALAAHKINELKAQNQELESKDSALANEAVQERQARLEQESQARAAQRQHRLQAHDIAASATRGALEARAQHEAAAKGRAQQQPASKRTTNKGKQAKGGLGIDPSGISRSEGLAKQQLGALEAFEHAAAAKAHKNKARLQSLWNAAEDDAAEAPSSDVPHTYKASRVNKAIVNWQREADDQDHVNDPIGF